MKEEFDPERVCKDCGKKFNILTEGGLGFSSMGFGDNEENDPFGFSICKDCRHLFDEIIQTHHKCDEEMSEDGT